MMIRHLEDVGHATAVALRQLGAEACDLQPVLTGESLFEDLRALQLVVPVTVDVVRVLRQHTGEDAVHQREHLPIDGPHALGRGLIAVLHLGIEYGHHRLQQTIADVLAEGDPLGVRRLLELIADMIVHALRTLGLCPGGHEPVAQVLWMRRRKDAVAYLYSIAAAKPKRVPTAAQLAAVGKALAARRTCRACGRDAGYCIPTSLGECVDCHYAGSSPTGAAV